MVLQDDWFQITAVGDDVYAIVEPGHVQFYLVNGRFRSALIDTGMGFRDVRQALAPLLRDEVVVLNTHWHYDHIGGNALFDNIGIAAAEQALLPIDLSPAVLDAICVQPALADNIPLPPQFDADSYAIKGTKPTFLLAEGDTIDLGGRTLEAIATPGHSQGSLSFYDRQSTALFCGDLAYQSDIYWMFAEGDLSQAVASLQKIMAWPAPIRKLWPCHGPYPLSPTFLPTLQAAAQAILDGQPPDEEWLLYGGQIAVHQAEGFRILTKWPGTQGIDLVQLISS